MSAWKLAGIALALGVSILALGCPAGGGGFTGGSLPGNTAPVFTSDDPTPGPLTLSLAPGPAGTGSFQVRVLVTDISGFFGAAFRVTFDPAMVGFDAYDATGSFLVAGGATDIQAAVDPSNPGVLLVYTTLQGQLAGLDAVGSQELIALDFSVRSTTAGSPIGFGVADTRRVTTCPAPPAACTDLDDASLTWSGGSVVAN